MQRENEREREKRIGNFYRRLMDGRTKSQSGRWFVGYGNHWDCDSFVKRIWKENTDCSPLLTLNTPANYQLSGVHKAPWRATDVAVSSYPFIYSVCA